MKPTQILRSSIALLLLLTAFAHADTVGYWRFEGAGFLNDSAGSNSLTNIGSVTQVTTPFSNPVPRTGATNANAASFDGTNYLTAANNPAFFSNQFTVEAFFSASDLSGATSTRMIAGVWGPATDTSLQSYLLGTRNGKLRLQFRPGTNAAVFFDAFTLSENTNYYAAATVDLTDTGTTAMTLYLQDLATGILQIAHSSRLLASLNTNTTPFSIGATSTPSAFHTGTIDEVRLSNVKLAEAELLITPPPSEPPPGDSLTWQQFRDANFGPDVVAEANPYADSNGNGIVNLIEHALGEDENTPGRINLPVADFSAVPSELTLSYPKAAEDIDYFAEWSLDLTPGSWSRLGFGSETQDPMSEWFSRTIQFDPALPRSFMRLGVGLQDPANLAVHPKGGGFRGLWYELSSQMFDFGRKYSGGLGTYTANHVPMAHYAPEVNRTFLTWGGTTAPDEKNLLIMVSYFDHNTGLVARPVVVMDKTPVNDAHDNGSMSIDEEGYLWIFVSGRNITRLGRIYRSKVPYGINDWIQMGDSEFTYPQPWWFEGKGFLHTYTRYTPGRELYYRTSRNGTVWSAEKKLAGLEGHYQTSHQAGDRLVTAFNRHPGRVVDQRTDLYYMETADMGETWTTADGVVLSTPITDVASPARIRNYSSNANSADDWLVYICDVTTDLNGHPVILYIIAKNHLPGPQSADRAWKIARWTGTEWLFHEITTALHNYDMGSIYIEENGTWKVIAPIGEGPQEWGTGGEIESWTSDDQGATWENQRAVTADSPRNHSYSRRPRNAHPEFYSYWADGHAHEFSESHLWFTNKEGDKLWHLPYNMTGDFATPVLVEP